MDTMLGKSVHSFLSRVHALFILTSPDCSMSFHTALRGSVRPSYHASSSELSLIKPVQILPRHFSFTSKRHTHVVPWDVIDQFDLMIPEFPADLEQIMLFMSGHLMFFKHEARVMEEFLNFPALRSVETFLATPKKWVDLGAGEPLIFWHTSFRLVDAAKDVL